MSSKVRLVVWVVAACLPWCLRRRMLGAFLGFRLHPAARLSRLALVLPDRLEMGERSRIDAFTVAINLNRIVLGHHSSIGRGNWITGFPLGGSRHFTHLPDRQPSLVIGCHSAITKNHHIDCTDAITVGDFTTIAGYGSQFLTHSVDIHEGRQHARPISIGSYCFVGTSCVVLGGGAIGDHSVLGACSLLTKSLTDDHTLYAGVPAQAVKRLPEDAKYFTRTVGFIN